MIWHGMDCEWMINLIVLQMASEKLQLGPISNQPLCIYIYTVSEGVWSCRDDVLWSETGQIPEFYKVDIDLPRMKDDM